MFTSGWPTGSSRVRVPAGWPVRVGSLARDFRGVVQELRVDHAIGQTWDATRLERETTYMAENREAAGAGERSSRDLDSGGYEQVALALMRAIALDERTTR
jgi:hypothetical protein